jgi:hypothetical protein
MLASGRSGCVCRRDGATRHRQGGRFFRGERSARIAGCRSSFCGAAHPGPAHRSLPAWLSCAVISHAVHSARARVARKGDADRRIVRLRWQLSALGPVWVGKWKRHGIIVGQRTCAGEIQSRRGPGSSARCYQASVAAMGMQNALASGMSFLTCTGVLAVVASTGRCSLAHEARTGSQTPPEEEPEREEQPSVATTDGQAGQASWRRASTA